MSKMGAIYAELEELGYDKVREIENYIIKQYRIFNNDLPSEAEDEIVDLLVLYYGVHHNTAIMLVSGALEYRHSEMLARNEDD